MLAETPVTQRSPCYSALSASLMNFLPFATSTTSFRINTSLVSRARPFTKPLRWRLLVHCCSSLLQNLVGNSCLRRRSRKLNNKHGQEVMFHLLFKLSSQLPFVSFSFLSLSTLFFLSLSLSSLSSLSQSSLFFFSSFPLSTIPSLSSDQFSVLLCKDFKFNSVSLLSEVPLARGSSALPSPYFLRGLVHYWEV